MAMGMGGCTLPKGSDTFFRREVFEHIRMRRGYLDTSCQTNLVVCHPVCSSDALPYPRVSNNSGKLITVCQPLIFRKNLCARQIGFNSGLMRQGQKTQGDSGQNRQEF
jgi:hypothetical protein